MNAAFFKSVFIVSIRIGVIQQDSKHIKSIEAKRTDYFNNTLRPENKLLQKAEYNKNYRYLKVLYEGVGVCSFEFSVLPHLYHPIRL